MRDRANEPISDAQAAAVLGLVADAPAVVLAVSGGPDSTALLWLAARWRDGRRGGPKLIAVTVDHGLRKESAGEALAVKRLAGRLKVEHRTVRWAGAKPKTGIQAAAREARYRLLARAARRVRASAIVTAHTLDDQAETVLFRLARGSGISGLAGMDDIAAVPVAESSGLALVRPLLRFSKARLIATLDAAKVSYSHDPSNDDPRFARPRLRALLPALAREGLTVERLGRLARRAARADETLRQVVEAAERAIWPDRWPPHGPVSVDLRRFFELPFEVCIRLLARMLAIGLEGAAELGQIELLYAELMAASAPPERLRRTLAGALITVEKGKLTVERAPPRRLGAKPRGSGAKTGNSARKRAFTKAR